MNTIAYRARHKEHAVPPETAPRGRAVKPVTGARLRLEGTRCLQSPPLEQGDQWLQKPMHKYSKSS
jgi:hypothetical protein